MNSKGRTETGIIVLIVFLGVLAFVWATAAFGFGFRGFSHWLWGGHDFRPFLPVFSLGTLISLALAVWVGFDANRRGMSGFLWGLLVFFTSIVERAGWAWGANFLDYDNDGDLDIYCPNGFITGADPADC